ncbi:SGNH/GDSL hydrolase family protein [Kocuria rosea]|uniref:SGNH/GDSL hydrolase family protein n=1 Tax=Kocuria rosea TaxID=1275 RepID=UPI0011C06BAC|nr:SGNH/GDSL hydrolase family protein [Kocuria rosea]
MQRTPRSAGMRQDRKPLDTNAKLLNGAIAATAGLIVIGLGIAFLQEAQAESRLTEASANYSTPVMQPIADEAPAMEFAPMDETIERMNDDSKPWTMTVLGDSTGNNENEWVQLVIRRLAERTGRPAEIHTWSVEANSYGDTTDISGKGEPIIVWNGSASGMGADYSLEQIKTMAPEPSDLVVISHAHNHVSPETALSGVRSLAEWAESAWDTAPALAVTLQNGRLDEQAGRQTEIIGALRDNWEDTESVALIDVFTAYKQADDVETLLRDDNFHPSDEGEEVWADTVWRDLDLDLVNS